MRGAERQGRMQRVLNPNAQNLKHTWNLAGVVHHTDVMGVIVLTTSVRLCVRVTLPAERTGIRT